MRLAVLSDIHGNLDALQAVLNDLNALGDVDKLWCLGDLAAFGRDPAACIQTVCQLPDTEVIQGNTDRYLVTGKRPSMGKPTEKNWPTMAAHTIERDANFAWTLARLDWPDAEYLFTLKRDLSLEVEGFGWVVGFHAIPGNDEALLLPTTPDHEVRDALLDREGSLAFGGHTHLPMDRDVGGGWRMVNPGSVGFPFDGDTRASYVLVTFEDGEARVEIRRVDYDVEAVVNKLQERGHPAFELMARRLRTAQS